MNQFKDIIKKQQSSRNKFLSVFGFIIGLSCVFVAVKLQLDLNTFENKYKSEGESNEGFIEVNKSIGIFNTLSLGSSDFNDEEIERLKEDDKIVDIQGLKNNTFRVTASSSQFKFRTELFFKSISEEFIDAPTHDFSWHKGSSQIPIIISNSYLNLYNHGFAEGQGLPQVSKSILKDFSIDITISGKGKQKTFKGRIVGYSDRINSVLVPDEFLSWANSEYGNPKNTYSSLILKVKDKRDPDLEEWINQNQLEINKELLGGKNTNRLFKLVSVTTAGFGLLVLVLSLIVISLSLKLSISKSKEDLNLLFLLGYSKKFISKEYFKNFLMFFLVSSIVSAILIVIIGGAINNWYPILGLDIYDFQAEKQALLFITLIILIALLIRVNIYRFVRKL